MHVLIEIALKSLLIAGLTLGLLQLLRNRSAAERSWVAHIGLLALVIMAFAPLVLPSWNVEAPAIFSTAAQPAAIQQSAIAPAVAAAPVTSAAHQPVAKAAPVPPSVFASLSPSAVATALYALPAAILLFITLLALGRLITLRARADVLVDGHWLSALARAQRRMGFKHGTALLTSDDLASPISWGLMRPVILLNSRAVEASDEAEASSPMSWRTSPGSTGSSSCSPGSRRLSSGSTRSSGCSPAKPTSCARKRPTTACSPPTSSIRTTPSCWSGCPPRMP